MRDWRTQQRCYWWHLDGLQLRDRQGVGRYDTGLYRYLLGKQFRLYALPGPSGYQTLGECPQKEREILYRIAIVIQKDTPFCSHLMPKVRKVKKYDYSKSYESIKEEQQDGDLEMIDEDLSAKRRGRRTWGKVGEKLDQGKSVKSKDFGNVFDGQQSCLQKQMQNEPILQANSDEVAKTSHFQDIPEQQTQLLLQQNQQKDEKMLMNQEKIDQKKVSFDKKQKLNNEETVTIQIDHQIQSKMQHFDQNHSFAMQQEWQDPLFTEQDNEQFILEFNPPLNCHQSPQQVFRSSFIYNNDYIRVQVYLDRHRKAIQQSIKAIASRKHPQYSQSEDNKSLKTQYPQGQSEQEGILLKRKKKKRTAVTAKVLQQVQLMFRHYEQQQKFYGTPCYRKKLTLKKIADNLSISATQIKHLYAQFSVDPLFTMRFGRLQPQGKSGVAGQQLQEMRMKFIQQLVGRNCVMTQQQMVDEMNQCQALLVRDKNGHLQPITRKIVQMLLRKGKYSRKKVQLVPKNRNSPQTIQNRYHYCKKYLQLLATPGAQIYFLDQSRFNMMVMRDRGWAKKGVPATKTIVNSKGKDIILLAIISISGLVWYELSDGYNAAAFTISIDKACRILNQRGANPHRYIILDNCPIHNRENLRSIQELHQIKMVYLPPYTPMLNPIEYWFNEVKSNFRQRTYKTRIQMKNSLDAIITKYREKSFENYYGCIKPYLQLGIRRELTK